MEKVTETWEAEASPYEEEKSPLVNAVQKIFSCCGLDNAEEEYSSFVKVGMFSAECCIRMSGLRPFCSLDFVTYYFSYLIHY